MQTLLQPSQHAETVQTLSMALIIFGTLAGALAVMATRREGRGLLSKVTDFFFGDLRTKAVPAATAVTVADNNPQDNESKKKTSRREIDNFDLSIFEDF